MNASDTLVLDTEWPYHPRYSGVFSDHITGEDFIYSGDPNTQLIVRVFNSVGDRLFDIPLDEAAHSLGTINSLALISPDSLFVIQEHGPKYVIVNVGGDVVKSRSLSENLFDPDSNLYEVSGFGDGIAVLGDEIYLATSWRRPAWFVTNKDQLKKYQHYYRHDIPSCKVAKLNPHETRGALLFGACGIHPNLADTPRFMPGVVSRYAANGGLFVLSPYSSNVMQLNTETGELLRKFPVKLANGPVGITPPIMTLEDIQEAGHNMRSATKGVITEFEYDAPSGHYLAIALHEVPEDTPEEGCYAARDWSLVVFDTSFNQIAEHVVPGKEYHPSNIVSTERGTWVLVHNPGMAGARQPKVFHRLLP